MCVISKNTKCIEEKDLQANKLDCCSSNLFLTLLICLRCSHNDFGGDEVSRDVLYEPGGRVDLISAVFSR